MAALPEDTYDVGIHILGTEIDDGGTVSCQTGDAITQQVNAANNEWWQHVGFASRPAQAEPGVSACEGVTLNRGDRDVCIATRDLRGQAIYGNLNAGEACLYAPGAQGKVSLKADGSVTLFTTDDNTADGAGVYLKIAPNKLQFIAPWGTLTFDATGLHMTHTSGVELDTGSLSPPGPLADVMPNFFRIKTAGFSVDSGSIQLGPAEGVFGAVMNTLAPAPGAPVLCGSPGSPTVPPIMSAAGVFVSIV